MKLRIRETVLLETIADVQKYYPNIPQDIFMQLINLDPTYTGKDSVGKYGKWLLNMYNRGKISKDDFNEIPDLLNQFTIYRNRIQNKDLNSYKTLDDLNDILVSVVDDDSMLTPNQKTKFLKKVKSGKIQLDKSNDYDVVLDTPNFIVCVPNTHEASMKLGKNTKWCTAHENPQWYDNYTEDEYKLFIVKNKKTGERWQYSDKTGDFLDQYDEKFDVPELMLQDRKLSKFFEKFLGVDYANFNGIWVYTGQNISDELMNEVTTVIISDKITHIPPYVFSDCTNLENVKIPNSVTKIGNGAFFECANLSTIVIPSSVRYIGESAFYACSKLSNITISEGVEQIRDGAFEYCENIKNLVIPDSVIAIGKRAFNYCVNLRTVIIPNTIQTIDHKTFANCSNLVKIIIPDSVDYIMGDAFDNCDNLTVYTDNEYVISYCNDYEIPVKPIS